MEDYNFVIVNEMDRPSVDHVAQVMPGGGTCRYLHPRLRRWVEMSTGRATNIRDFGFGYRVNDQNGDVIFFRVAPSEAKYSNGETREWQDDRQNFTLSLWCHDRKEASHG